VTGRPDPGDGPPEMLKTSEAARLLGVSRSTVLSWAYRGLFDYTTTPGGQRRFFREQVEAFVARQYDRPDGRGGVASRGSAPPTFTQVPVRADRIGVFVRDDIALTHCMQAKPDIGRKGVVCVTEGRDGVPEVLLSVVVDGQDHDVTLHPGDTFPVADQTWKLDRVESPGGRDWTIVLARVE
jgi:excisionase family DNA binding protein